DDCECAFDQRRTGYPESPVDSCKAAFGKLSESIGKIALMLAQDVDSEVSARFERSQEKAVFRDGRHDARWLEGERTKRVNREAMRRAIRSESGDKRHACGEAAAGLAKGIGIECA